MNGIAIAAVSVLCSFGPACPTEHPVVGLTISSTDRVIVLADGTRVWPDEAWIVSTLQEGVVIKLSYEEQDGQHVVTSIEAAE